MNSVVSPSSTASEDRFFQFVAPTCQQRLRQPCQPIAFRRRADVPTSATLAQKNRRLDHQETVFLSLRTAR
jgi:hypothetical protein